MAEFLPTGMARIIPSAQAQRSVRVSLNAQGDVEAVAAISGDSGPTDAAIAAMIRAAPFLPALHDSEPIASELTLTLDELVD